MYAAKETDSVRMGLAETGRRRTLQQAYNEAHGITPQAIIKQIDEVMSSVYERDYITPPAARAGTEAFSSQAELAAQISTLLAQMRQAAANLDFEKAASLRDDVKRLRNPVLGLPLPAQRAGPRVISFVV